MTRAASKSGLWGQSWEEQGYLWGWRRRWTWGIKGPRCQARMLVLGPANNGDPAMQWPGRRALFKETSPGRVAGALEAGKPDHRMIQVPNADKTATKRSGLGISLKPTHSDTLSTRNARSIKVKTNKRGGPKEKATNSLCRPPVFPQSSCNVHPPVPWAQPLLENSRPAPI